MKRQLLLISCLGALVIPHSARAADVLMISEPVVYDWSGAYLGAQGAWLSHKQKGSDVLLTARQAAQVKYARFSSTDVSRSKGAFGLYAGYNAMLGNNFVAGVEVDFAAGSKASSATPRQRVLTSADFKKADGTPGGAFDPELREMQVDETAGAFQPTAQAALRLRLGASLDRVLGYVSGGLGLIHGREGGVGQQALYTEMKLKYPQNENTVPITQLSWTLGAGLEFAATDTIVLRGEYRYTGVPAQENTADRYFERPPTNLANNPERVIVQYKENKSWNHDWRLGIAAKF